MATTLTVTPITPTGIVDTLVAADASGNNFPNDGKTRFEVLNGSGAPINVTFTFVAQDGVAGTNVVAVAAGVRKKIGPFNPSQYNDSNGRVNVTYSAATTVTVGAFN